MRSDSKICDGNVNCCPSLRSLNECGDDSTANAQLKIKPREKERRTNLTLKDTLTPLLNDILIATGKSLNNKTCAGCDELRVLKGEWLKVPDQRVFCT